jgi:hypothetical protein
MVIKDSFEKFFDNKLENLEEQINLWMYSTTTTEPKGYLKT